MVQYSNFNAKKREQLTSKKMARPAKPLEQGIIFRFSSKYKT